MAAAFAVAAVAALVVLRSGNDATLSKVSEPIGRVTGAGVANVSGASPSPFSPDGRAASSNGGESPDGVSGAEAVAESSGSAESRSRRRVAPLEGSVDVTSLGWTALDDDTFEALAARLAEDSALMAALVDEFRSERDPERLARLAVLLGEAGGPEATALAAELAYSADDELRVVGLDLLRRVQPGNAEARDIVSGMLANGTDRDTLVPVLQTLTRPGVVPVDERTRLAGQVALLSTHEDPGVRRLGLGVLSRWSEGSENVELMRGGLADPYPGVREAAAHALVGRPDPDGSIAGELFAVADDTAEEERVRRAALLALKNLPLGTAGIERRLAIERLLDRRPVR